MFFLIAGIQPKLVDVDSPPRQCPSCGLYQAGLKRQDHYFSLFFLPLIRVKKGVPFLQCRRCGSVSAESGEPFDVPREPGLQCRFCRMPVEPGYRFCPHCGKTLS